MKIDNLKILVVDDNPTNLGVLFDYLNNYGFTVLLVQDGEKALRLTETENPDVILLDIIMPGIDGYETCRRLKNNNRTKDIPVIFMSALSETVDKVKGLALGAVDYITKPFQQEEVLARVKTHLTIQTLQNELKELLELERKRMEDLRLSLSLSLPHELRSPLSQIIGYAEMLREPRMRQDSAGIEKMALAIQKAGLRLARLVDNYLLYANLKLINYPREENICYQSDTTIDSKTFLTALAQNKAGEMQRSDDLVLDLVDGNIRITTDRLKKIVEELLDNSFKFSNPGTPVRLQTEMNQNRFILKIIDRGRGMTANQIVDIEAYMQFERKQYEQQGSGLGLIIACLLTALEGGRLSINSKLNQETTVSIVFDRQNKTSVS